MYLALAGCVFLVALVILEVTAHVCKKVRIIRNVPVTWSGREYRNVTPRARAPRARALREPREPRVRAQAPTAALDDVELVARVFANPTASLQFAEYKRMLDLGFARVAGQWRKP